MKKPRLKLSHHVLIDDNGDLCIGEVDASSYIVRSPSAEFLSFLSLLDGSRTIPRLARELQRLHPDIENIEEQVVQLLDEMGRLRLIDDAALQSRVLTATEMELYDRQMLYFSQVESESLPSFVYQERLKGQRVAVLGLGGWGTWTSLNLALQGFGSIRLVDGDIVERSNLNRQVLYREEHIGTLKVDAAAETLRSVNPHILIEPIGEFVDVNVEQVERLLADVTLIFLCWANLAPFMAGTVAEVIHSVALNNGIPVVEFGGDPFDIFIGPIYLNDGKSACLQCSKNAVRKDWYSNENMLVNKFRRARLGHNYFDGQRRVDAWQSAPSLSAMTGFAVDQAVKLVTRCEPPALIGKRVRISMRTLEQESLVIERDLNCAWCAAKNAGVEVTL